MQLPLDKSWIMRMGILDLLHDQQTTQKFLDTQKHVSDDVKALQTCLQDWKNNSPLDVGESGTLYRFLRFISWKLKKEVQFIKRGTLETRNLQENKEFINMTPNEVLLNSNTSQWASAALLAGAKNDIKNPPYKIKITLEAIEQWEKQWQPRYDETIKLQAETFLKLLENKPVNFLPKQAEDYCFARAFNFITKEQGTARWPALADHESNRLIEMEEQLKNYENNDLITSKDHRVVQAIAMKAKVDGKIINYKYPEAVNKTWPQFWEFLKNK